MESEYMHNLPPCPQCGLEHTYTDTEFYFCPDCGNEWSVNEEENTQEKEKPVTRDAHGTPLEDGDSVTVIKDLKVRGSSMVIKQGTMIKDIRIIDGDHDIDCKVNGTSLQLKSEFMKKA